MEKSDEATCQTRPGMYKVHGIAFVPVEVALSFFASDETQAMQIAKEVIEMIPAMLERGIVPNSYDESAVHSCVFNRAEYTGSGD